jgi:hypothetical protein
MSETEEPPDKPASLEGIVKVTVHRKLTFKNGDDYNSIEGFIEFPESRTHALTALGETLNDLRQLLEEEKSETLTKQAPTLAKTPAPPSQQTSAKIGDPYAQLPWNQSKNDTRLGTIRVTEKLKQNNPLALQLYNQLKAAEKQALSINRITYRLSVTTKDSQFVPAGTEYLQRWGEWNGRCQKEWAP